MTPDVTAIPLVAYQDAAVAWARLREYLGSRFRPEFVDEEACCAATEDEFARLGPDRFYRESQTYLYELTNFHFTPYKHPFYRMIVDFAAAQGLRKLADVGCGVGLDAQALMSVGLEVVLYEFDSPSRSFAAWRLERDTGVTPQVHDIDELGKERHDLAYAVDALEHVPEPSAFLRRLFAAGRFVAVNLFPHDTAAWDGVDMHYPLNHWELLPVLAELGDLLQLAVSGETVATLWKAREAS